MFRRHFSKRLREHLSDEPRDRGPHHEDEWADHEYRHGPHRGWPVDPELVDALRAHHEHRHGLHRGWRGRDFGGWRPPFAEDAEAAFQFGPRDRGGFDRPFGRGGPFGGGPFGEDGGGRRRQRRGDIRYALLELLAEQPRHGYELIKELEQRYGGFYRPSPGSVYPTLQLLEDEGHLTSDSSAGKRVYTITDSGRQLLAERQPHDEPGGHGPHGHGFRGPGGGPELHQLRESGMALIQSVMQLARHGTPEQIQAVMKLLDTTRREIYAILSQDEADRQA